MSDRRAAATLMGVTVLVVWGLITHGTFAGSGDEPHYLMIARSIAFDADVDVENDYADPTNLIGAGDAEPGPHVRPGRNGVLRPVHDIGLPLLAAPAVRLMYPFALWIDRTVPRAWLDRAKLNASLLLRHQISLLMAVVAGSLAIALWRLLMTIGVPRGSAMRWSLLLTLSPPLLSYSFLFFTELVSALIVTVCVRRLNAAGLSPRGGLLLGLLTGLLTFIHVRNAAISLAIAAIALAMLRSHRRSLTAFAIGVSAFAAIRTAVNWHFWGALVTNEHARIGEGDSGGGLTEMAVRATGLLLDQEFGLLPLAPLYLVSLAGFVYLLRRAPRLARHSALIIGAYAVSILLPFLNVHRWDGGWSPSPRFLVPVAPLLGVAVVALATRVRGARSMFVKVLAAAQMAIAAVVWNEPKVLWNPGDGLSAVADALPWLSAVYAWMPTWYGPSPSAMPFAIAVAVCAAVTVWLLASEPDAVGRESARRTRAAAPASA